MAELDLCVEKELLLMTEEEGDSSAQPHTYLLPDALHTTGFKP